jgi:UDP-N-acetylmuramate--alanine ligase
VLVVDDYGHHPVEVRATLRAARAAYDSRRLVVIFQPHRYTRLRDLMEDFAAAFNDCHVLLICDVYPANEAPIDGVDGAALAERARALGHRDVRYVGDVIRAAQYAATIARPQDLVLTLGAGNVWQAGEALLSSLSGR